MLLSPVTFDGFELPNRVVMAPIGRNPLEFGRGSYGTLVDHYAQRATAGLIVTETVDVAGNSPDTSSTAGVDPGGLIEIWRPVVDAVHARGGRIAVQISHDGGNCKPNARPGEAACSPVPMEFNYVCRVSDEFRIAAMQAKEAGFDAIELLAGGGQLIDVFLQSHTNQRRDNFGGSLYNRFRLLGHVLDAVLAVWPRSKVGVRLSPNVTIGGAGAPDFRDTFLGTAERLDGLALGFLHVVDAVPRGFHGMGAPLTLAEFRRVFRGRLIGNGGYSQQRAESVISAGDADLISFGRSYRDYPDLVERFAANLPTVPLPSKTGLQPAARRWWDDISSVMDLQGAEKVDGPLRHTDVVTKP